MEQTEQFHTADLCDRFEDEVQVAEPILHSFGGKRSFKGRVTTVDTFEELAIPFHAVATDFHSVDQVVFQHGPLLPALKASMAIPGVFEPVVHEGRVLVDGGIVDNVPWRVLEGRCDAVIAIDVPPARDPESTTVPGALDTFLGSFETLIEMNTKRRLEEHPPALYFRPDLRGIRTLDFNKIESVFEQAEAEMERLRVEVRKLLSES